MNEFQVNEVDQMYYPTDGATGIVGNFHCTVDVVLNPIEYL